VDALEEVIQQALTSETLHESWTKGVLSPVYKKGDKLHCTNYRNIAYNVFAEYYTTVCYPTPMRFSITKLGSSQANQRHTNSALRQILEIGNEYNFQTHHLFIDFKEVYDIIIQNEVYVSMSELSFPTKQIRLRAATLNTVLCCVKIQNDCTEYFGTWQELTQVDVLSTLIFNILLNQSCAEQNYKQTASKHKYLVTPSQIAVRETFLAVEREANKVGLKINEGKTKYMIAAGNERTIRDVGQSVAFGDKTFEVVKKFVYLRSLVTPNNDGGESRLQIDCSSDCTNNCSGGIFHVQQNSSSTRPRSCRSCCMAVRHGY
jgi:Reverse transcriptase (RNA-dependent DNA polymerase)